jgi:hypothetical protein
LHRGHAIRRVLFQRSDMAVHTTIWLAALPIRQPVDLRRVLPWLKIHADRPVLTCSHHRPMGAGG